MNYIFSFVKVLDVKTPIRGTKKSAGIDFFIPEDTRQFRELFIEYNNPKNAFLNMSGINIYPHKDVLIPSGIHYKLPENTMLLLGNKSGIATKYKVIHGAHIGDEDYQGHLFIHLINTSDTVVTLSFGQKVIQGIIVPVYYTDIIEYSNKQELYIEHESERKEGGFGSTGIY